MKTTIRFFKLVMPFLAVMLYCGIASAQSVAELTVTQSDLQSYITLVTQKINDAAATGLTQDQVDALQQRLDDAQIKLGLVNDQIAQQTLLDERAQQQSVIDQMLQQRVQVEAEMAAKNEVIAAQQSITTAVTADHAAKDNPNLGKREAPLTPGTSVTPYPPK